MSASEGIRAELVKVHAERDEAAKALDASHRAFMSVEADFRADQKKVFALTDRLQSLVTALRDLGDREEIRWPS